jgi:muramoyltetrapeptide carboxypeptidase LdcA involved in peptidoglycan recycling
MHVNEKTAGKSIYFIAPSTRLTEQDLPLLKNAIHLLRGGLGSGKIALSAHLFTRDEQIDHVTASTAERSREFKEAIREHDIIISIAGGTGAEDLLLTLDRADFRCIRKRRPLFIGFSDFSILLNEAYSRCRVPGILFPCLRLNEGNVGELIALIQGNEVMYRGSAWLSDPPPERVSGVPIGGNLTTFVNFLNRLNPPRPGWRGLILFIEDVGIDIEDLHRLLAALRRHRVFSNIKGLVIGSLAGDLNSPAGGEFQDQALSFIMAYLAGVLKKRREQNSPLPIMVMREFAHDTTRGLPAVPVGGLASLSASLDAVFRLK